MYSFGDLLQELRRDDNLTQEELAQKLHVSRPALAKYETDENEPNFDFLIKCSDYFDVSVDYLLCKTKVRTPQHVLLYLNNCSSETLKKFNIILQKFRNNEKYIDFVYSILMALKSLK